MVSAIPAVTSVPDRAAEPLDEVEEAMGEEEAPFLGAVLAEPLLRKSFSLKEKREFVRNVDAIVATGLSRRKACLQLGVPHGYYAGKGAVQKIGGGMGLGGLQQDPTINSEECMDEDWLRVVLRTCNHD